MKIKTTLLLLITTVFMLEAQTVRTITDGNFFDDLFMHPNGVLYGSEYYGNTIWEFDTATEQVTIFRDDFANPNGIAMNPEEKLFICDHTLNKIIKFETDGTVIEEFTGIFTPSGVKNIPNTNDMLFVEYGTSRVGVLHDDGTSEILYVGGQLWGPAGIAYIDGVIYVSNYNDRKIIKLENGTQTLIAQLPAESSNPNLNWLGFIDSKDGLIYATSGGGNKIYQVDPVTGNFSVFAGNTQGNVDGPLDQATFNQPNGILFDDASDRLYISEAGSNNLRIIENVSEGLSTSDFRASTFDINIYPNPSGNNIIVEGVDIKTSSQDSIKIFNTIGVKVFEQSLSQNNALNELISISSLSSGNYIVSLSINNRTISKMFIKK
jgi:sugar lactone lactonase YvrE